MSLGVVSLPKELGVGGGPLDIQHIESVELSINELTKKYEEMAQATKVIKTQLKEQK